MRPQVLRWLTIGGLILGLLLVPRDECSASLSGNCVIADSGMFAKKVGLRETAHLRLGDLTVTDVRSASRLEADVWDDVPVIKAPPKGRFVMVSYRAKVKDHPRSVRGVLRNGEQTFSSTVDQISDPTMGEPGVEAEGTLGFLVPEKALNDNLLLVMDLGAGDPMEVALPKVFKESMIENDS